MSMSQNPNPYYQNNQNPQYQNPQYQNHPGHSAGYTQQNIVIANQKSIGLTYVLWFFLGGFGVHKFYLGQTLQGLVYLGLTIVGWSTSFLGIGFLFLGILWIALIIDLFTIPKRVESVNRGYITNTLNIFE